MAYFDLWSKHSDCLSSNGTPKRRYYSESEAQNSALYQQETRGVQLRAYHCPDCGYYHVTHHSFFADSEHKSRHRIYW